MFTFAIVIHIIISVVLIFFVLLQTGKGSQLGAVFGGMGQDSMVTPETLLHKLIMYVAILFILSSIALAFLSQSGTDSSILDNVDIQKIEENIQKNEQDESPPATPAETETPAPAVPETNN